MEQTTAQTMTDEAGPNIGQVSDLA